jgi:hypothetical protein
MKFVRIRLQNFQNETKKHLLDVIWPKSSLVKEFEK